MKKTEACIEYHAEGKICRVSRKDISSAMCSTDECLDAGFNLQLQTLVDLLESRNGQGDILLENLTEKDLEKIQAQYPGTTSELIEQAVKRYYNYAKEMYYI